MMGIAMIINRPAPNRKANVHRLNHLTPFVDIEVTAPASRRTTAHHTSQLSASSYTELAEQRHCCKKWSLQDIVLPKIINSQRRYR